MGEVLSFALNFGPFRVLSVNISAKHFLHPAFIRFTPKIDVLRPTRRAYFFGFVILLVT